MTLRLRTRIVLPFLVVAVLATTAAALVAVSAVSSTLRARVQARTMSTTRVVSRGEFALNPAILRTVKEITGADVVTFSRTGAVLATTLTTDRSATIAAVTSSDAAPLSLSAPDSEVVGRDLSCDGTPCYVAYQRIGGRSDGAVAVVAELSEVTDATQAITRALAIAIVFIVGAVFLVSQLITRRVTAPLERLVQFTRDVSSSPDSRIRAETGPDDVGRLGTAFNEMLDRLQQSREALVRSEKLGLAGLLAARVAHDVRNPLSSMKMQAQLLRGRLAGADEDASVAAILRDIATVEAVVRDLLEVARPEQLRLEQADINEVIRELLEHLAPQLAHRAIRLSTSLDATGSPVPLDRQRLGQALLNVIVNACDAMPGGGLLEVATRTGADAVTIEVRDNGTGIDPAIAERVFDPFVSTKRDGVGLGLVNARAVVDSHGGTIRLQPREPRGTIAVIMLPTTQPAHG